jgi:7-cyano-7-deazaguanine reductase
MIYQDRVSADMEMKALKTLGNAFLPQQIDRTILQTIDYEYPQRKITVTLTTNELTCLCPFSGLPDFAQLTISYVPRKKLIEMKSFKYYIIAFRNVKIYNEHVVNKILEDLVKALNPYEMTVCGQFTSRGGTVNKVTVYFSAEGKKIKK